MRLTDLIHRPNDSTPWARGHKLPWSDRAFSERMLKEHLDQSHDAASRRFEEIDRHVHWIHTGVLKQRQTRVLDLGCGPGLYANRLVELGHRVTGIDFAPAAIRYARQTARQNHLDSEFVQADVRKSEFGRGFGLVMMLYAEINTFESQDVDAILNKARRALSPGGMLLLECHTFDAVKAEGTAASTWNTAERGLFGNEPHLWLRENAWSDSQRVATANYYVVDAKTARVQRFTSSLQAYSDQEYRSMLKRNRFGSIRFEPGLAGPQREAAAGLKVLLARKPTRRRGTL